MLAKGLVQGFKDSGISQGAALILLRAITGDNTGLDDSFWVAVVQECWLQNLWTPTIKTGEKRETK